jgi:hypothetical protein
MGFESCVVPRQRGKKLPQYDHLKVIEASNIGEAIRAVLGK